MPDDLPPIAADAGADPGTTELSSFVAVLAEAAPDRDDEAPAEIIEQAGLAADSPDDATLTAAHADESAFLAELVRAVKSTAGTERARIADETEGRRQSHIDRIRARQAAEAERMRELAAEDQQAIDAWADDEAKRIQAERERRGQELQRDLEQSLAEHRSGIDREIDAVEAAIATYRAQLESFFEELDGETDLVRIAQQAARRPTFPDLDAVAQATGALWATAPEPVPESSEPGPPEAGDALASAEGGEAEPSVVGVMDASPADTTDAWLAGPASGRVGADVETVDGAEEPVAPEALPGSMGRRASLLASVPALRPMSRRPHDAEDGEGSTREG